MADYSHLQGWVDDKRGVEDVMNQLPFPVFSDVWTPIKDTGKGKITLLYDIVRKVNSGLFPNRHQTVGDCLEGHAMIKMADGTSKPIADIKAGDKILTPYGNIKTVTDTIKKPYNKKMVRINVSGLLDPLTVTPDHLCMFLPNVKRENKKDRNKIEWTPAIDLNIGDKILLPKMASILNVKYDLIDLFPDLIHEFSDFKKLRTKPVNSGFVKCKNSSKEIKRHIVLDGKLGYLIGMFAAEGSHDNSRITFNLSSKETHIAKKIILYIKEIFGCDSKTYQVKSKPSVLYVRISSKIVSDFFHYLCNGNTYTKKLHPKLLISNEQVKMGILDGWLTGDGWKDKIGVSVNYDLIHNMFDIALSLGINPTIIKRKAHKQSKESYSLNINSAVITNTSVGYKLKLSQKCMTKYGKAATIKNVQIINSENKFVYCLVVEDDHCFIADRYGVHNCVSQGAAYVVDVIKSVDIHINKDFEQWVAETATEDIYWGSRNIIGQGRLGNSDGSIGAWAAKYLTDYGALPRGKYGDIDLTTYSGAKARSWGRRGFILPQSFIDKAKQHPILTASQVRSYEEVRDLVSNGYAVTIASNQGFSSRRDKDGFARPEGSWAHQMCIIAVDDEYKRPGVCVQNCFSDDTEVLTNNGWKFFKNLDTEDKVATYNMDTFTLEYQSPTAYQDYYYNGKMLNFIGRNKDVLVTPDHNMMVWSKWHRNNNNKKFKLQTAKDVNKSNYFIKYAENFKGVEQDNIEVCGYTIKMDDWLEFLGYFLSEGWSTVRVRERSRNNSNILTIEKDGYTGISQNSGTILDHMEDITNRLPWKFNKKKQKNSDHYQLCCYDTEFAEYMSKFGKAHNKFIPEYVFGLSKEQQRLILKTLLLGDGRHKGTRYTTNSTQLRDGVQRLAINLGFTSDYHIIRKKGSVYRGVICNHNIYDVTVLNSSGKQGNASIVAAGTPRVVDYKGRVYCVTVPNHTVITRRNGKMIVSGQSWGSWNSGPVRHNQPVGSFWVDASEIERRVLRSGDCWAFSGYEGFKPQKLKLGWF